jgi:hypothetical protein
MNRELNAKEKFLVQNYETYYELTEIENGLRRRLNGLIDAVEKDIRDQRWSKGLNIDIRDRQDSVEFAIWKETWTNTGKKAKNLDGAAGFWFQRFSIKNMFHEGEEKPFAGIWIKHLLKSKSQEEKIREFKAMKLNSKKAFLEDSNYFFYYFLNPKDWIEALNNKDIFIDFIRAEAKYLVVNFADKLDKISRQFKR